MTAKTDQFRGWTRCWRCALSLLVAASGARAETTRPTTATVAVLEAEVREARQPEGERGRATEDWRSVGRLIDTVTWSTLGEHGGFVLVDRALLDQVLREKTLTIGLTGGDASGQVAATLKAAGVLVVPEMTVADQAVEIRIETVAAATGQLLDEYWVSVPQADAAKIESRLKEDLPALWQQTQQAVERQHGMPLVEIVQPRLVGGDARLQWLADDLGDRLRAATGPESGMVLLRPRQAISTKEERLLAVMGLTAMNNSDDKRVWGAAPDVRVEVEIAASAAERQSFDQTPLRLSLVVSHQGDEPKLDANTTVAAYESVRTDTARWLQRTLRSLSGLSAELTRDQADATAREYASQELAAMRDLASRCGERLHWGWNLKREQQVLRARVAQHALRAAHLDPTSEEAARHIVLTVDSFYFLRGQERSRAHDDRIILEGRRYLERFPGQIAKDNATYRIHTVISSAAFQRLMALRGDRNFVAKPFEPQVYQYSRIFLDHALPVHLISGFPKNLNTAAYIMRDMFMHCPPEKLEAEYAYWREVWHTQIMKSDYSRLVPWVWIEMGYWTAKQDFVKVRRCYEELAARYPRNDEVIWGRSELRDGKPYSKDWIEKFLKRAGDPEWQTWEPGAKSPEGKLQVNIEDWRQLLSRLYPRLPSEWDYAQLPRAKAERTLTIPRPVMDYGSQTRNWGSTAAAEIIGEVDQELWLLSPGLDRRDIEVGRRGGDKVFRLRGNEALEVPWPTVNPGDNANAAADGHIVAASFLTDLSDPDRAVLIGTNDHGLACYRWKEGAWEGQWIGQRHGLPGKQVAEIRSCIYDGRRMWLVVVGTRLPEPGRMTAAVCVVDPQTLQIRVLHRTSLDLHLRTIAVAQWPGVASVPVAGFEMTRWPELDWAKAVFPEDLEASRQYCVLPGVAGARPRVIFMEDRHYEPWEVGECDPVTGQVLHRAVGGGRRESVLIGRRGVGANGLAGESPIWAASQLAEWTFPEMPPWGDGECAAGPDGVAWMAVPGGQNIPSSHRAIVGYRPAPIGSTRWHEEDQWIGPFAAPDGKNISGLLPDGRGGLWISTSGGVFKVSAFEMINTAKHSGAIRSSDAWRSDYEKRVMEAHWRHKVRLLISKRDPAAVEEVLNARPASESLDADLYHAYALGQTPEDWERAAALYDQIIARPDAEPAAKMLAFCNRILVLQQAKQWQELLSTIDRYHTLFPQTASSTGPGSDPLQQIAQQARQKLATTRPRGGAPDSP